MIRRLLGVLLLAATCAFASGPSAAPAQEASRCIPPDRPDRAPDLAVLPEIGSLIAKEICADTPSAERDFRVDDWFARSIAKTRERFSGGTITVSGVARPGAGAARRLFGEGPIVLTTGFGASSPAMVLGEVGGQDSVCAAGRGTRERSLLWNRPDQWGPDSHHTNIMVDAGALLEEARKAQKDPRSTRPAAAWVARWLALWRDFASNNWRCAQELAADPALREQVLRAHHVAAPPPLWGSEIQFRHQYYLAGLVGGFVAQYVMLTTELSDEALKAVEPREIAEIVYFVVVYPFENLLRISPQDTRVTNQWLLRLQAVADAALVFDEFSRTRAAQAYLTRAIDCAAGPPFGGPCKDFDTQPDGSGAENCYNYMSVATKVYADLSAKGLALGLSRTTRSRLAAILALRGAFQDNLVTPTGTLVQCKNRSVFDPMAPLRRRPPSAYRSIAFPYNGLYVMRDSWGGQALYLALQGSRRGGGHETEDTATLTLEADGRTYLANSPGEFGYFGSSFSKNTVVVDGLSQARTALPRRGGYENPLPGRWASTEDFDVAEAIHAAGYGRLRRDALSENATTLVGDVRHRRVVVFVKALPGWLVVDQMIAPSGRPHDYAQLWNFDAAFDDDDVVLDRRRQSFRVRGDREGGLTIHQAATAELAYRRFRGHGWTPPVDRGNERALIGIPLAARGWQNRGGGYRADGVTPSPTVEVGWTAPGPSVVMTLLVPSKTGLRPAVWVSRAGKAERLQLAAGAADGRRMTARIARQASGDTLLVTMSSRERGTAVLSAGLDHDAATVRPGSIVSSDPVPTSTPVASPEGFHWRRSGDGFAPRYGKAVTPSVEIPAE